MQRELKGTIQIGGTIRVGGPDICARLKRGEGFILDEENVEFCLAVENRLKDQLIEVTPWINLSDAELEISTPEADDFQPRAGLTIAFRAGQGRHFDLAINAEQASVIAKICESFASACSAVEFLANSRFITAPQGEGASESGFESHVS